MNNVSLVGRATKDPELRYTQNGTAVVNFTLAINRMGTDGEADFIRITAWDKVAETTANYVRKGDRVGITGRIQTGTYENNEGATVYTFDVIANNIQFLEPKKEENEQPSNSRSNGNNRGNGQTGGRGGSNRTNRNH